MGNKVTGTKWKKGRTRENCGRTGTANGKGKNERSKMAVHFLEKIGRQLDMDISVALGVNLTTLFHASLFAGKKRESEKKGLQSAK